jgi:hypothetical protein
MERATHILAAGLSALTCAFAAVYWKLVPFGGPVIYLIAAFWLIVALSVVVLFRIRTLPIAAVPVLVAAATVIFLSAPSAIAWTLWSINGFAP